jgi:LAO/AO transport system kinase
MLDVLKASNFDLIIVETVGVGQSEVEIAGLADKTMVVLVPESGDEIQNIKSGLMEIANAFVVNKADREGADIFCNNLKKLVNDNHQNLPVFKTVADKNLGIDKLCDWILTPSENDDYRKKLLVADKIFRIIQHKRMQNLDKAVLIDALERAMNEPEFNAYKFAEQYTKTF